MDLLGVGPQLKHNPNILPILIGAAIGAGVGSYGHDNWGWSKDAIWQGGLVGGAGGYMAGGMAGGAGAGVGAAPAPAMGTLATSGAGYGGVSGASVSGAATGTASAGSGMGMANAMMLGSAGLGLASAFSSKGSSFQDKIELSKEGKALQGKYATAAKGRMGKAAKGDVSNRAFQDISNLKTSEGRRERTSQGSMSAIVSNIGNAPKEKRGGRVMGGGFAKAALADAGKRMEGLFAPTSILNSFRKEELLNATKHIQNLSNIDNQTSAFNYSSSLAKWGANQMLASEKGAAIGNAAAMYGMGTRNNAYYDQMMKISA